jgi:lipopolysaccharide/colanic/teichoic acid biosynthesis glycosyltransferase
MNAKRLFDLIFSFLGLVILSPFLLIISLCILCESGSPMIYRQKRLGKDWKEITLYKFRTMNSQKTEDGLSCSPKNDKRITQVGKYLRKYKLDELPQLFNVLRGDMSFVGPRPELPKFVEYYSDIYKEILKIKPGITDLASIKFRDESSFLDCEAVDVEKVYLTKILPQKLEYSKIYLKQQGFFYDIRLIFKTIYFVIFK